MGLPLCLRLAVIAAFLPVTLQGPHQRTLLKELLKDYNRMERPVANDSQPLTVHFSLSLMQIMDVDEKNQVLTSNIWLQMYWYDHYLRWNQSDYPGVKNLRFTTDQVWTPDILLYNSADDRFDASFKTNVLVNSSGYCQYLPPGIFMSTCNVDVRWFPFDIQKCELKFGSWTYDGWLLDLQMNDADISGYLPNGEWDLIGVPGSRNEIFYDCCKEPYPDITFYVTIRRRTLYYALNLLIPCVLLSSMTLLVFLLPADSGEKISLGITVLLSLTVFMLLVAEIMPATSDSIPLIGQYFASTMIIVGLSVVATVVVLQYHHHDPTGGKMPKWVQLFLFHWVAWFLRMKRPGETGDPERPPCSSNLRRCSSTSGSLHSPPEQNHHVHVTSSHLQTPSTLTMGGIHTSSLNNNGNLLYIGFQNLDDPSQLHDSHQLPGQHSRTPSVHQHQPPLITRKGSPPPHHIQGGEMTSFGSPPSHNALGSLGGTNGLPGLSVLASVEGGTCSSGLGVGTAGIGSIGDPQLNSILEEVRFIADRFREQDAGETITEQWKFAAAVIDRLCLVAFSIFNIICTISILMSAPNFVEAVSKDFI
ncbi:cholinergic receptor, nicotinic, alpha 11 isoform X1 [Polypterus senegalus]|uniref:cholinergic receptor, nicotinic, alpha 11 isoform X1 n=2 Tax=Polypterus senegalus TaxID=55291 RepID=UPI001964B681|nr:cholinergic receptor, nicotinic, alpha 11 isoform X1 [Polypterus senegalus]